jgi:hypothetical protein
VLFVCCLIVVPLPPGENPFAVNDNNDTTTTTTTTTTTKKVSKAIPVTGREGP